MKFTYNFALCEGRHAIPQATNGAIFPAEVNPLDPEALELQASYKIPANAESVNLYVTGLSVALVAVINVCTIREIRLTLWHYNRENGEHYSQSVW